MNGCPMCGSFMADSFLHMDYHMKRGELNMDNLAQGCPMDGSPIYSISNDGVLITYQWACGHGLQVNKP